VARGYLKDDDAFYTGMLRRRLRRESTALGRPALARGQERFNIYCAPCHDRTGSGPGHRSHLAQFLAALKASRSAHPPDADGQIFDTITHGKANHAAAIVFEIDEHDRWAIVAYVRALRDARPRGSSRIALTS